MTEPYLHINRGPAMHEVHREHIGERWCFACRKYRQFIYVVMEPIEPSYYGPSQSIQCEHCKRVDADLFPGRTREWP